MDQVESMETMLTVIYLFVLDGRLALLSLVVFPAAFVFMMMVMGNCAKDYDGAVKATNAMSGAMIEYINGIEVIKAFNQGKKSYGRLIGKVRVNAQYYYDWMRHSQLGMAALVGSGKSKLAKLAAGFWDVKNGAITMGGHDLKDIPLMQLYEQTAFVSRDNYLFDDTVRENIRMGWLSATDLRWRPPLTPRAAAASSRSWKRAAIPSSAEAALISRAARDADQSEGHLCGLCRR